MALLHADGFDHWADAAAMVDNEPYEFFIPGSGGGYVLTTTANDVRTGRAALQQNPGNGFDFFLWARIYGSAQVISAGSIAIKYTSPPAGDVVGMFFSTSATAAGGSLQCCITIGSDGTLKAWRGDPGGVLLGSSDPGAVTPQTFNGIQWKVFVDDVNGSIEIRVGSSADPALLLTGIDTKGAAGVGVLGVYFGKFVSSGVGHAGTMFYDDFALWDTTTAFNNDFDLDAPRMRTRLAVSNGPEQDWVSNSGGPAFDEINRVPPVPAVNFIKTDTAGSESNFGMTQVPVTTAYCKGIRMVVQASKSDSGACSIGVAVQSGIALSDPLGIDPGITPGYYSGVVQTDPATGTYFTVEGLNASLANVSRAV